MLKASIKLIDGSRQAEKQIADAYDLLAKQGARIMEENIKKSATHSFTQQTGNLRRSIRAVDMRPFHSEVQINPVRQGADTNYAKYLEFGTRYIAPRAFIRGGVQLSRREIMARARKLGAKVNIVAPQ